MEAASRGAAEAGGTAIGIVPGHSTEEANEHCTHVVATGIGHARNLAVVCSGEVVIAVGGEWGTLSEIGLARRAGAHGGGAAQLDARRARADGGRPWRDSGREPGAGGGGSAGGARPDATAVVPGRRGQLRTDASAGTPRARADAGRGREGMGPAERRGRAREAGAVVDPLGERSGRSRGAAQGGEQAQRSPPLAEGGEAPGGPGGRRGPGLATGPVLSRGDAEAGLRGGEVEKGRASRREERGVGERSHRPGRRRVEAGVRVPGPPCEPAPRPERPRDQACPAWISRSPFIPGVGRVLSI